MRLLVYEMLSAGGFGAGPSLRQEGSVMLAAAVEDFGRLPGVAVTTLLGLGQPDLGSRCLRTTPDREPAAFRAALAGVDAALIIAPEPDDQLAARSQLVLDAGRRLLGCVPDTIRAVADKRRLADLLIAQGVPAPPTWSVAEVPAAAPFPRVLKPRVGAGAQATWLLHDAPAYDAAVARPGAARDRIVQPFCAGTPASIAFLCGPSARISTPGALQLIEGAAQLAYAGGRAPLPALLRARALRLGARALDAAPPVAGYVGVDLILGADPAGADDVVIEINPRLTTSYIGLRRLTSANLAEHWLALLDQRPIASPAWTVDGVVTFRPDGTVAFSAE